MSEWFDICFMNGSDSHGEPLSVAIKHGKIAWLGTDTRAIHAHKTIPLDGQVILPGFVDGHIHLDKSFLSDRWQSHQEVASISQRLGVEKRALAQAKPMALRAEALLQRVLSLGTVALRCHVDVDATTGMDHLLAVQEACAKYSDQIYIEWVAFPQAGVMSCPGTLRALDNALQHGATVVGGIDPEVLDGDRDGQLDALFDLAQKHAVKIDIHLHEPGTTGIATLAAIAARTKASAMQGQVAVSHAYALGDVSFDEAAKVADVLADAGVAIMTNAPGDRAFPPVKLLHDHGVNVFAGNDNIRDAWWPYGSGDMLQRAMLIGYRSGFYTDKDLLLALDMATHAPATALGVPSYGLEVGNEADFVVIDEPNGMAAVAGVHQGQARMCVHRGRLTGADNDAD